MDKDRNRRTTLERELDAWEKAEAEGREAAAEAALRAAFSALPSPAVPDLVASVMRHRPGRLAAASRTAPTRVAWAPGWLGQAALAAWMVAAFLSLAWVFESAGTVRPASVVGAMLAAAQGALRATAAAVADLATIWRAVIEVLGSIGSVWSESSTVLPVVTLALITVAALGALRHFLSERSSSDVVSL